MDELVGQQLGQYQIVDQIGEGGMASVYLATQSSMGRDVAIKVLPRQLTHDGSFMERFYREVDIIAALQHPHIVPVYDFGEYDGRPYLVMAHLSGGTLADLIDLGPMNFEDVGRLVTQIASALDYAHSKGVIHRDFKPSNVLLDEQGNVYLSDFGLAKVSESSMQLTGSGIIGTPFYMAPEQANPGEPTRSIDIYALGVTVFQMLTGHLPYEAPTAFGVLMAHVTKPVPNLQVERPDLPAAAQEVIDLSMAKESDARYPSTGRLASELVRILKHVTSEMSPVATAQHSALLFTNVLGQVIFVDHYFLKMMKRRSSDVRAIVGKPLHEIIGLDSETVEQLIQEIGETGRVSERQLTLQDARGAPFAVFCGGVATYDNDGAFVGADITLRRAASTPDSRPDTIAIDLNTKDETMLQMYFTAQVEALHELLIRLGGQRLGSNLETIINETSQRNVWPVNMQSGRVHVELKITDVDVYNALLSKAAAFARSVSGPSMVRKKMQGIDKTMDVTTLELVKEKGLDRTFGE